MVLPYSKVDQILRSVVRESSPSQHKGANGVLHYSCVLSLFVEKFDVPMVLHAQDKVSLSKAELLDASTVLGTSEEKDGKSSPPDGDTIAMAYAVRSPWLSFVKSTPKTSTAGRHSVSTEEKFSLPQTASIVESASDFGMFDRASKGGGLLGVSHDTNCNIPQDLQISSKLTSSDDGVPDEKEAIASKRSSPGKHYAVSDPDEVPPHAENNALHNGPASLGMLTPKQVYGFSYITSPGIPFVFFFHLFCFCS